MLAQESEIDAGMPAAVAVVAPRTNAHAHRGVEQMTELLAQPERRLALIDLEAIIEAAAREPILAAWAETFFAALPRTVVGGPADVNLCTVRPSAPQRRPGPGSRSL